MKDFLNQLLQSLNLIEVKGKTNMDILLGCIMAIEQAIEQLSAPQPEPDGAGTDNPTEEG